MKGLGDFNLQVFMVLSHCITLSRFLLTLLVCMREWLMYSPRLPLCFLKTLKAFLFLDKWDIFLLIVSRNTTHAVDQLFQAL